MKQHKRLKQLNNDEAFDEIRFETKLGPIVRCVIFPRYKTSGLSGDEWRISAGWQQRRGNKWVDYDNGYSNLETATKALYPALFSSHRDLHDILVTSLDFYKKGFKLYEATYDGKSLKLLHAAGHLPWAFIGAQERRVIPNELNEFCMQPGCDNRAISTYQLKKEYGPQGQDLAPSSLNIVYYRKFCQVHLLRGDCGREDADRNYIIVDGVGPDQAQGWKKFESKSKFGGVINLPE